MDRLMYSLIHYATGRGYTWRVYLDDGMEICSSWRAVPTLAEAQRVSDMFIRAQERLDRDHEATQLWI
jgi:hypothetical protein